MWAPTEYWRGDERPDVAEVAVTVTDDWQRRGVGRALLQRLATHAHGAGVHSFSALVLGENRDALDLLSSIGAETQVDAGGPEVRLLVELPTRRGFARRDCM